MVQLAEDRQRSIIEEARKGGGVVISDLARRFSVSEMTIRRDLKHLERQGVLNRVHGGAVPAVEVRFGTRLSKQSPGKAKAAEKLVRFLPREGSIYLDGSTTMLHLVGKLRHAEGLQVATNNIETFQRLCAIRGIEPLLIGGRVDRRTDTLIGALALRSILAIAFDAAFFSAYGISSQIGPMEVTIEDAEIKDLVASRSRAVYLAMDETKLGQNASGVWQPDKERTTLATSLNPEDKRVRPYASRYANVI